MHPRRHKPVLVAIVGGSGSGKTWLAASLQKALGNKAARICLDDFYRDRSHLTPARRQLLNFDHPRAIDWVALEQCLRDLVDRGRARIPAYNFATHCRGAKGRSMTATPILLLDGLWLLRRPSLRRLFSFSIFLDCPASTRLQRRITRDRRARGRTESSVREQFSQTVEPMHRRFVSPQSSRADVVLAEPCDRRALRLLAQKIRSLVSR